MHIHGSYRFGSCFRGPGPAGCGPTVPALAQAFQQSEQPSLTPDLPRDIGCYLVANPRERSIPLRQVEGSFTVVTSADWILEQVTGDFRMQLDPGASSEERARADAEAMGYIKERMKLCPVSRSLPSSVDKQIELSLES